MSARSVQVEMLIPPPETTKIAGSALKLLEPISFWGGVSPIDGRITDPLSRHCGVAIGNKVLFIRNLCGSSSGSSVLLELIYKNLAPVAIILSTPDAILAIGALVGREMGWATPAIIRMPADQQTLFDDGALISITADGLVTAENLS